MSVAQPMIGTRPDHDGGGFLFAAFSRWLELAGDGPDADADAAARKLRLFRLLLMVHAPVELLRNTLVMAFPFSYFAVCFFAALVLCLAASFLPGREQLAARLYVAFLFALMVWLFPGVSNHFFIVFFSLLLLALLDPGNGPEALLGLRACRWVVALVLFWSGMQKMLYGSYFHGQYLVWTIAHDARFTAAFGWLLPAAELERIGSLRNTLGPFTTDWLPLLLISNFVWLFELAAPALLLWRRTRAFAVAATIAFLVAIEVGAHELLFAALFVNALMLFARGDWHRRLLPLFFAFYATMLLARLGLVLGWGGW